MYFEYALILHNNMIQRLFCQTAWYYANVRSAGYRFREWWDEFGDQVRRHAELLGDLACGKWVTKEERGERSQLPRAKAAGLVSGATSLRWHPRCAAY
jgi:hypothetical protein